MSADLSWRKHYDLISSCVYKTLGLLCHTFNTTNSVHVKKLLYLIYHWYAHNSLTAPSSGSPTYTRISHVGDLRSKDGQPKWLLFWLWITSSFTPNAPSDDALWAQWCHFLYQIAQLYYQQLQHFELAMWTWHQIINSPQQSSVYLVTIYIIYVSFYVFYASSNYPCHFAIKKPSKRSRRLYYNCKFQKSNCIIACPGCKVWTQIAATVSLTILLKFTWL